MRRFLLRLWTGTGLLAALLTSGCQHNRNCCSNGHTSTAAMTAAPLVASRPALAANAPPPQPYLASPPPAVSASAPVVHTAAKLNTGQLSPSPLTESYPDAQTPASEPFGHDPNYRWLVGTVDYSQIQRAWLLRYVPFEQDDRYGGCVTLVGTSHATSLKPGQTVRVEGTLIDPDSRHLRPAYQVQNIRVIGS